MGNSKNVVLLGKGSLSIKIAEWFKENYNLVAVVPDTPEPTWTASLSDWAKLNDIPVIPSGDYEDIEGIDDGDILGKVTYPLYPEVEEVEDVYQKALDYGWLLFKDVASKLDYALENATPQSGEHSYYSNRDNDLLGDRGDFRR